MSLSTRQRLLPLAERFPATPHYIAPVTRPSASAAVESPARPKAKRTAKKPAKRRRPAAPDALPPTV